MKIWISGMAVWLVGNYILTEVFQFDNWSIVVGYALGLFGGFVMLIVSERE